MAKVDTGQGECLAHGLYKICIKSLGLALPMHPQVGLKIQYIYNRLLS